MLQQRKVRPLHDQLKHRNTPLRILAPDIIARNPNQLIRKNIPAAVLFVPFGSIQKSRLLCECKAGADRVSHAKGLIEK